MTIDDSICGVPCPSDLKRNKSIFIDATPVDRELCGILVSARFIGSRFLSQ